MPFSEELVVIVDYTMDWVIERRELSMGAKEHAHVEAALAAILLTLVTYGVKWLFGLHFPELVFMLPTFLAVFLGFYLILFVVFLIAWCKK
jgi:hypothetical protein